MKEQAISGWRRVFYASLLLVATLPFVYAALISAGTGHNAPSPAFVTVLLCLLTLASPVLSFVIAWKAVNEATRAAASVLIMIAILDVAVFAVVAYLIARAVE